MAVLAAAIGYGLPGAAAAQTPLGSDSELTYRLSVDYFFQASTRQQYPVTDERFGDSETFFWERLRPKLTLGNQRVTVVLEGQDTHSRGSEFSVRKAWLDVLNAYVDVRQLRGWSFKIGRRQGDFDTITRLVRTSEFAAVVRSFDVAELGWQRSKTDVRLFYFRTVDNRPDRFNTWKKGEQLWTTYVNHAVGHHRLQTYLTSRWNSGLTSETGVVGDGTVHAWEVMAAGPTSLPRLAYSFEHMLQRGHASTDDVRAYGMFAALTATLSDRHEVEMRYVRTSGDAERGDGVKGSYDTFYMALGQIGGLGLMRGSNLHALSIGSTHLLTPKMTLGWRLHDSHATTKNDGWYSSRFVHRPGARSSRIGNELNTQLTYNFSPKLNARLGYYRLFPGRYLEDTGTSGSPYELRLQIFGGF